MRLTEIVEDRRFEDIQAECVANLDLLAIEVDPLQVGVALFLEEIQELAAAAANIKDVDPAVTGEPVAINHS